MTKLFEAQLDLAEHSNFYDKEGESSVYLIYCETVKKSYVGRDAGQGIRPRRHLRGKGNAGIAKVIKKYKLTSENFEVYIFPCLFENCKAYEQSLINIIPRCSGSPDLLDQSVSFNWSASSGYLTEIAVCNDLEKEQQILLKPQRAIRLNCKSFEERKKSVNLYLENEFVKEFSYYGEAAEYCANLGFSSYEVLRCSFRRNLKGDLRSNYGYILKYSDRTLRPEFCTNQKGEVLIDTVIIVNNEKYSSFRALAIKYWPGNIESARTIINKKYKELGSTFEHKGLILKVFKIPRKY